MLLNDEAGCPGKRRVSGGSVGVCYSCARYGKRSDTQIEPAAKLGADGVWQCDERRSAGVVLTDEQVAAMDEMALSMAHAVSRDASVCAVGGVVGTLEHGATLRSETGQGKPTKLGGLSVRQATDEAAQ